MSCAVIRFQSNREHSDPFIFHFKNCFQSQSNSLINVRASSDTQQKLTSIVNFEKLFLSVNKCGGKWQSCFLHRVTLCVAVQWGWGSWSMLCMYWKRSLDRLMTGSCLLINIFCLQMRTVVLWAFNFVTPNAESVATTWNKKQQQSWHFFQHFFHLLSFIW